MAPLAEDCPATCGPFKFTLALALAVAKSKPPGVSIRDHLAELGNHVSKGKRLTKYGSGDQYIDAVGIYRDRFEKAQETINDLQARNVELETKIDRLRAETKTQTDTLVITPQGRRDRATATPTPTPSRSMGDLRSDPVQMVHNDSRVLDHTEAGSITAQHLYRIYKILKQGHPSPGALAYHLSEGITNLACHISMVAKGLQKQQLAAALTTDRRLRDQLTSKACSRTIADMQRNNHASLRSFTSLLHGLEKLFESGTESAEREHGAATYAFIQAVETILSTIATTCKLISKQQSSAVNGASTTTAPAKSAKPTKTSIAKKSTEAQIPRELTTLLCALLSALTPDRNGAHAAVFEGILFLLLDRTGKCLYPLTFGYERTTSIEDDIEAQPLNEIKINALNVEVKFLAQLLERAMNPAPVFLGSTVAPGATNLSKKAARSGANTGPRPSLTVAAKETLQATLIYCMYGDRVPDHFEAGNAKAFIDILRKPAVVTPLPKPPVLGEADVPEWFKDQMWKLVGWDILTRVGDW